MAGKTRVAFDPGSACRLLHLLLLLLIVACGMPSNRTGHDESAAVVIEGDISSFEREAWNDLASCLAAIGQASEIKLSRAGGMVTLATGEAYPAASPTGLGEAMVAVGRGMIAGNEATLPPAEELLDGIFRDESWEKIAFRPDGDAAAWREGAVQAAVLAFLLQNQDGAFPARRLAARSFALEALARARSPKAAPDPILAALQAFALGRPDEARSVLADQTTPAVRALDAFLRTDLEPLLAETSPTGFTLRLLARQRDGRNFKEEHLRQLDEIAPQALIVRRALTARCDVVLGHHLTPEFLVKAAERAVRMLGEKDAAMPDDPIAALGAFAAARRRAERTVDPLLVDLADGFINLAIHLRYDFLMSRFGHEPSAHAFGREIAKALGADHPVVAYSQLRILRPEREEVVAYSQVIRNLPDWSRHAAALAYLHSHDKSLGLELFRRLESELDDSDIVRLKLLGQQARRTFKNRAWQAPHLRRALLVDPFDPAVYKWAGDRDFDSGLALIPYSAMMVSEKASRIGNRTFTYEANVEEVIRYLERAGEEMADDADPGWTIGGWHIVLGRYETGIRLWREALARVAPDGVAYANASGRLGMILFEAGHREEALAMLEKAARSHAATPLGGYAAVLEASGRIAEAERHFKALVDRYQGMHWMTLAAFYDRVGRPADAEELYREEVPKIRTLRQRRSLFRKLYFINPGRLVWLYDETLLARKSPYDDSNLAIALVLTGRRRQALETLEAAEADGRMNPSTIWFHYVLLIKEKGLAEARAYLERRRSRLDRPAYQADVLAALAGEVDPGEILDRYAETSFNGTYQATLCPVIAFTWQAERRPEAPIWMDRSARSTFESFYLPLMARAELGIPPGDWWRVGSPRAARRKASGMEFHY